MGDAKEAQISDFERELQALLNKHSREAGSDTPDFILASFLERSLVNFTAAVVARRSWWGCDKEKTNEWQNPRVGPDEPCSHPGCKSHVSHPCEGCGRQW